MALTYIEGFDYYGTGDLNNRGWVTSQTLAMVSGRFGGQAFRNTRTTGTLGQTSSRSSLGPTTTTAIFGGALWFGSTSSSSQLRINCAGGLSTILATNGTHATVTNSSGTGVGTGTASVTTANWHYWEVKTFCNGASGTIELYIDGALDISSTAGNFGTGNAVQSIAIFIDTSGDVRLDDLYVLDTTGSANTTYLGDVRVTPHYATSDGAHSQWTPTGGGSHWSQVDEHPPDGDTTYVSDANPGDIDTYGFDDVDGGATVFGVQTNMYARKDDANVRQIAAVARQGGTDYVGSTQTMASSYTYYTQLYNQDPTGSNWTATNFNNDEFGVKEIA